MSDASAEKLSGSSRVAILKQIRADMIAIQLIVTGIGYERLTLILDVREENGKPYVIVDCPEGFVKDVPDHEGAGVKVEFLGKDRVQYCFLSRVTRVLPTGLWMEMPEYLERVQRRDFFRIAPPARTCISFSRIGKPQEASLINLSEGGALVTLNEPARGISRLVPGERLRNLRLRCKGENLNADIRISRAAVVREQPDQRNNPAFYALEFMDMDSRDRRLLQEFIFMCQREILRKRNERAKG